MSHSAFLKDFAAKAVLDDLRLVSLEASVDAAGEAANIEARFDASSRVLDNADGPQVDYRVRNETEVKDAEGQVLFSIKSTWALHFNFAAQPTSIDEEVRREFQTAVVMMTIVPYVRELVNSTASRFGLPGVVVPLIKAGELHEVPSAATQNDQAHIGESAERS